MKATPQPFYVVGPTGSGKSALAIALANRWGGEIVNADAFQLYSGLDICTAKPNAAECALAPHHLYGVLAPTELCDAAFFAELAKPVIADIALRGAVPIVVGGSGLYIKALTHGLSPLPSDEGLRRRLAHLTAGERVSWLLARDSYASTTVNLKNDRYVTRALEICLLTGKRQSDLRKGWQDRVIESNGIQLAWNKDALHHRINQRVHAMVAAGLVDEIRKAAELSTTAEKAIGVREMRDHLKGRLSLEDAIAAIQLASRQYAQRQVKWFRREKGFVPLEIVEGVPVDELVRKADEVRMAQRNGR
ncbi:MAG: tRNA (adenosine(37)-N6)-dimethylallyltransferase MiaA [Verrucomicrobium sp.]